MNFPVNRRHQAYRVVPRPGLRPPTSDPVTARAYELLDDMNRFLDTFNPGGFDPVAEAEQLCAEVAP